LELKLAAIEAHASQFAERGITPEFQRDLACYYGRMSGFRHAEGLEVLHMTWR
jgi:hypothetical protein